MNTNDLLLLMCAVSLVCFVLGASAGAILSRDERDRLHGENSRKTRLLLQLAIEAGRLRREAAQLHAQLDRALKRPKGPNGRFLKTQ